MKATWSWKQNARNMWNKHSDKERDSKITTEKRGVCTRVLSGREDGCKNIFGFMSEEVLKE